MKEDIKPRSVTLLKALADDIRLGLAKHVAASPDPVPSCTVVRSCSQRLKLSQPAMSHHFKKLVDAGILDTEKQGTQNFYKFNRALCEEHGIDIDKL